MKKTLALLLLAGLLLTTAACANEDAKNTTAATTTDKASSSEPEPADDTLLFDENYEKLDLSQYVTLPSLSAIKLSKTDLEKYWNECTNQICQYYATYEDTEEGYAAVSGDLVNIHYKGYAANESDKISEDTLKNMSNFAYDDEGTLLDGDDLVLGSGSMIGAYESEEHPEKNNAGFEDQLIGIKAGETRTITVTFPDSYENSEELQGVVVKFDVTANSIQKGTVPELTDEMVFEYYSEAYATIEDLKQEIENYYKGVMAYEELAKAATIKDYPADLLKEAIDRYIDDYIEFNYQDKELTDEERQNIYDEQYEDAAETVKETVATELTMEMLFKEYSITLTWGEYKTLRAELFQQDYFTLAFYYGITTEEQFEEYVGRDRLARQCKYEILQEILAEQVVME